MGVIPLSTRRTMPAEQEQSMNGDARGERASEMTAVNGLGKANPATGNAAIRVRGAREHNLKNIDGRHPARRAHRRDRPVRLRQIVARVRHHLRRGPASLRREPFGLRAPVPGADGQADVDSIEGLSPAISIEQKTTSRNPRSTVGTITEVHDYMRLLWARAGVPYSPATGLPIEAQTVSQMVDRVLAMPEGTRLMLLAPVIKDRKGEYRKELAELARKGFTRAKVDGTLYEIADVPNLNRKLKHTVEAVVDRVVVKPGIESRLADSFEQALGLSDGVVYAEEVVKGEEEPKRTVFSSRFACPVSGFTLEEIEPRLFSFNAPQGACPVCDGIGVENFFDPHLVVPDETLTLAAGAVAPWNGTQSPYYIQTLQSLVRHFKSSMTVSWEGLPEAVRQSILHGTDESVEFTYKDDKRSYKVNKAFEGVLKNLQRRYAETDSVWVREEMSRYQSEKPCHVCNGARLRPEALSVKIDHHTIADASELPIRRALEWFATVEATLTPQRAEIARRILREILDRLRFLDDVGLDYLTLSRGSATLSGGESQRIRLASQIGSGLTGVLYVLDEPSIGLHQRDNERLLGTLDRLKKLGNTLLVVEHDEEAIRAADYLIDMGPAAGVHGGNVIASGTPDEVAAHPDSLTGAYLSGRRRIEVPTQRRVTDPSREVRVIGATGNNLKNVDAAFPLGTFTCITGVSGGGKSTLVIDTLYKALSRRLMGSGQVPAPHERIEGLELLDKIIDIDQSPIGRTPRSNPATYTDLFAPIRDWFAELPDSKARGYKPGRFSFNVKGGRCEACQGRRRAEDRDALPAGRVRHLRHLQGRPLQPRDAGGEVPRPLHRRRAEHDGGRGGALFLGRQPDSRPPHHPAAGRARLREARAAGDHPVRRRGAAGEAVQGAGPSRHRPHALHPRRTDHRAAHRGCPQAAGGAARAGRPGQHGAGDRAQPRGDQDRRLGARPRTGRWRRRRTDRRGGHAGRHRGGARQPYRPLPGAHGCRRRSPTRRRKRA